MATTLPASAVHSMHIASSICPNTPVGSPPPHDSQHGHIHQPTPTDARKAFASAIFLTTQYQAYTPPASPSSSQINDISTTLPKESIIPLELNVEPPASATVISPTVEVECQVRARIPTIAGGEMFLYSYKNSQDTKEHMAIVYGSDIRSRSLDRPRPGETALDRIVRGAYQGDRLPQLINDETQAASLESISPYLMPYAMLPRHDLQAYHSPPLVRIHSECYTGETVHSARCDCGEQLDRAMELMQAEGRGIIVYLRQEGRGIGLTEKLKAYNLQDLGFDTVNANLLLGHGADERQYGIAAAILRDLVSDGSEPPQIRLLTNNPDKIEQLEKHGLKVGKRVPMVPRSWTPDPSGKQTPKHKEMDRYLEVKIRRMRHLLDSPVQDG
ncbi:hypothetical protein BZG36_02913 [Bifiguratus adelaidae]|uniref:GTP cyclohydrolase II n=1 Tax=Bifiguratus adelaidae TaxID=1938954 RepID=A0A261Y1E3_9FUNG|nr:hypothetical protein BZG36_02913 [Bifiguratus adelaidae]